MDFQSWVTKRSATKRKKRMKANTTKRFLRKFQKSTVKQYKSTLAKLYF